MGFVFLVFCSMFESEQPLAERLRPKNFDEYHGQQHLVGKQGVIRKSIETGRIPSMIFWGPPGVGKTSLANVIAHQIEGKFYNLSAVNSGVKEVREVISRARYEKNSVVFIDEIHRFNKTQQDALLQAVEKGYIRLIGATTENPSFEVNSALLSRAQVYILNPLSEPELKELIQKALATDIDLKTKNIAIAQYTELIKASGGDARRLLNLLDHAIHHLDHGDAPIVITDEVVVQIGRLSPTLYDKGGDMHYDVISAFIKSIRGSDPNAAVYWLARMIEGGEDPKFIARRLLILSSEDIGLANPTALVMANNCFQAVAVIGYPECRIILSQTAIYLATSPKSNSSYQAINHAQQLVKQEGNLPVPLDLRGGHTPLNKALGFGKNYQYAHAYENNFVDQDFLPDRIQGKIIFEPANNPKESQIREWLKEKWSKRYKY